MQQISKSKTIKIFLFVFLLFAAGTTNAQVGIGTPTPNASAQLDVNSTSKGFLPPRMTQAQRNAITNPVAGLIIWCKNGGRTASGELNIYNGTRWTNLLGEVVDPPFQIGDHYGGGIVIQISDSGQHGYIAALEDLGPQNWTLAYILCERYRGGGYSDWFFPTKGSGLVHAMLYVDNLYFPGSLDLGVIFLGSDAPDEIEVWDTRGGESKCCYGWETDYALVRPVRAF